MMSIPPEDTLEEIVAPGIFVPKRKPLPIPYISPRFSEIKGHYPKRYGAPALLIG
jgi:hypothetical protein